MTPILLDTDDDPGGLTHGDETRMNREFLTEGRCELAFDSSALSDVLNGRDASLEELARDVKRRGARLVLCERVLYERLGYPEV